MAGVAAADDAPYPFADQIIERQKRKHESIRGSEARIVRSAGSSNYTGIVPLFGLHNATKAFESLIEQDFWTVFDFIVGDDVIDAKAQPGFLDLDLSGRGAKWYPDMWIRRSGRRDLLVECKPAYMVHPDPKKYPVEALYMAQRLAAMAAATERMGMDFALYTELEIRIEPRLTNAKAMRRGLSAHIPKELLASATARLSKMPRTMTVRAFAAELGDYAGGAMAIACRLDRSGDIQLDRGTFFVAENTFVNFRAVE